MLTLSADHLRSRSDSNVISNMSQAGTPGNIRLPRLWANSKEMKTDTYHSHAYVHHTTAPQSSRHKSGHSPIQRTISYSEKPVTTAIKRLLSTEPFVKVEHLFRNDFDDTEPVFVLISASMFCYNVPVTNISSHRCRFKKWAQHWAQKETFPW